MTEVILFSTEQYAVAYVPETEGIIIYEKDPMTGEYDHHVAGFESRDKWIEACLPWELSGK